MLWHSGGDGLTALGLLGSLLADLNLIFKPELLLDALGNI